MPPAKMNRSEILAEVQKRTGLTRACVKELLKAGWTYTVQKDNSFFIAPKRRGRVFTNNVDLKSIPGVTVEERDA